MNVKDILSRLSSLKGEHLAWHGIWEDCARYCLPNAVPIGGIKTRGTQKKMPIDTTGVDCAEKLSSWLYSSTVYQGEKWFDLRAMGVDLVTKKPDTLLNRFLEEARDAVLETINASNFIQVYQQFLRSYAIFGTGIFYSEFDSDGNLFCRNFNVFDKIYLAENNLGEIDTVFREFEYTARQAVQEFGYGNVSSEIRKAFDKDKTKDRRFSFLHAVYPRGDKFRDKRKTDKLNKAFADIYIEIKTEHVVREGGHDTFPYCCPRFFNTGEVYGRSAAMSAYPSLRAINIATYAYLKGVEFACRPMVFADSDTLDSIEIKPGAKNPLDGKEAPLQLWSPHGDVKSALEFAEMQRAQVNKLFYVDVFQYLEDRKNMTATEAQLRYDEMIQGFAPVLANLQSEFFRRFIERIALELCRIGFIQVPHAYRKHPKRNALPGFDVIYTTRLDTKIKGVITGNMRNFIMLVGEFAMGLASAPTAAAYIDADKFIKTIAQNCDCSNYLLEDKQIEANLEAQRKQAQEKAILDKIKDIDVQNTPVEGSEMAKFGGLLQ